ncbi:hypothetical protein C2G38_2218028 [Gigaspora rosea]|uniref:Uncharacterized protein n=1 Tax=Gigaspora rosea TaxID=44941 RepID=A0A397UFX4_9GLOM|nr:hypothetical protein C2G38_2218028 [Gigaspora rosea]
MISLPIECHYPILNNLRYDHKSLFSCALVNRQWCRIIIPILWSEPKTYFKDIRLIRILLLTLNDEEKAPLIRFNITLPNHPKPLFEYTSYITSVSYSLYDGAKNWLDHEGYKIDRSLDDAIKCSLITMLLRTSKNLKSLSLNEIINDYLIFESLFENTTITSMYIYVHVTHFKFLAIDTLVEILYKHSSLTYLDLSYNKLWSSNVAKLLEALYENTILNSLNLCNNQIGIEGGKMLAKFLCKNTTLTSLNLVSNNLGSEGGKALADALCKNTTLISLDLGHNNFGSEEGKALADALCKNTTLTNLYLQFNVLRSEGVKALAGALSINNTLTTLNLCGNNIGSEGGKALADVICMNTTLTFLDIRSNYINFRIESSNQNVEILQYQ